MKKIFLFLFMIFSVVPNSYCASELSRIQTEIKQNEQKNKKLEQQLKASDADVAKTKKDLVKAAGNVSSLEEQRDKIQKKIEELDAQRDGLQKKLNSNQKNVENAISSILFVAANPSFDSKDMHDYVLTSAILSDMADRFDAEIKQAIEQIKKIEDIRQKRAVEKEKLDRSAKKYADEKLVLDKLLRTRSAQNQKLKQEQAGIQKKLRELSMRAKSISELSAGVGSSKMSGDAKFSRRKLNLPVRGRVVVHFGEKTALGLNSDGWRIHTRGQALVMAPADGVVKFADNFKGFGKVIIMSHKNGYNTVMTNLGDVHVIPEQEVLAGEPVGRMNSDKSEMYLEVRRGNKAVDPSRLFNE
ncbi:MAG: murein hydrolase activator EnvC family protein [Alphaproteobacteria bacterium]